MVAHNLLEAIELSDKILFCSASPSTIIGSYEIQLPRAQGDLEAIMQVRADIVARRLHAVAD